MKRSAENLIQLVKKIVQFVSIDIWRISSRDLSRGKSFLITQLRILILAMRGVRDDKILLRAPALTFYSLFSIVPAAALIFGIAQGFGLEHYVERQLESALTGREEVLHYLMELTDTLLQQFDGGALAAAGLLILLYAIAMLLSNMEKSFNEIWQVSKGRPLSRKFADYFAMIFITPLFFILAGSATVYLNTQVREIDIIILSPLLIMLVRILPYLLIWAIFTLLYMVMPNTNVHFKSALTAGIVSGTIFQIVQWAYINFQIGATTYSTIYGSFAALPLFLIWMQISWIVILFGAELSYANHNVENYEYEAVASDVSLYNKKVIALCMMHRIILNFKKGEQPLTPEEISKALQIPSNLVRQSLNDLESVRLVNATRTDKTKKSGYQPAIDINKISIKMVIEHLENRGMHTISPKDSPAVDAIKNSLEGFYDQIEKSNDNYLLKDL